MTTDTLRARPAAALYSPAELKAISGASPVLREVRDEHQPPMHSYRNVPTNTPALYGFNITTDKGIFIVFPIFAPLLRGGVIMYIICVYKY